MRWLVIPLVMTIVGVSLVLANAQPSAPAGCTWVGTPNRDVKTGTSMNNTLCALRGRDYLHGAGGNDQLIAGRGRDTAVGGKGQDVIRGGGGRDHLFAVDARGGDRVVGGPGQDQCFIDRGDTVSGCERTFRSQEPQMATALGGSLLDVMQIVEESPTPTPVTVTVTDTITLPPCNQGPPDPPPFCGGG